MAICERKIVALQKQLKSISRLQIERIIQQKCAELKLVYGKDKNKVKNLHDLKLLYKSDSSVENCITMWNIMIGQFETGVEVLKGVEQSILEQKKWKYSITESDKKLRSGFVEKILLQQRRQKIRLLNNVARISHGRTFMLSRPSDIIHENNKFIKRKKGICDPSYMIGSPVSKKLFLELDLKHKK